MNREEIILKLNELHELSVNVSKYNRTLKELPNKTDEINKWINDDTEKIKSIQNEIERPLHDMYRKDIIGKYFCNVCTWTTNNHSLMLMHVTDTFCEKKSQYWNYDVICKQLGEFLYINFTRNGDLIEVDYTKETDRYDMKGGYLSSHNLYGILSEKLNGWKEIDKKTYEDIISKYRPSPLTSDINLETLPNMTKDFTLSEEQ
jgi:hypothetical protein